MPGPGPRPSRMVGHPFFAGFPGVFERVGRALSRGRGGGAVITPGRIGIDGRGRAAMTHGSVATLSCETMTRTSIPLAYSAPMATMVWRGPDRVLLGRQADGGDAGRRPG